MGFLLLCPLCNQFRAECFLLSFNGLAMSKRAREGEMKEEIEKEWGGGGGEEIWIGDYCSEGTRKRALLKSPPKWAIWETFVIIFSLFGKNPCFFLTGNAFVIGETLIFPFSHFLFRLGEPSRIHWSTPHSQNILLFALFGDLGFAFDPPPHTVHMWTPPSGLTPSPQSMNHPQFFLLLPSKEARFFFPFLPSSFPLRRLRQKHKKEGGGGGGGRRNPQGYTWLDGDLAKNACTRFGRSQRAVFAM